MDRILVVLPNWIGETLFATPFLKALRQHDQHAAIATLGWPQCEAVLRHHPAIDVHVTWEERARHRGPVGAWRLARELRCYHFDTVFILRKSLSRTGLMWLAGIPQRIGFDNPKSGWLLTTRVPPPSIPQHKAARYLALLAAIGAQPILQPYDYVVSEEERRVARESLQGCGIVADQPLVVLHPGANWAHKRWALDRFAMLGDRLVSARGVQVLITGGPEDLPLAQSLKRQMRTVASVMAGHRSLRHLGAILEQARLVVSNDTGILHLAAAMPRPIVALYGPTSPALTGPLGHPERMAILHHPDCCPRIPCYEPDRPAHLGMNAISVDEVYEAATNLLRQYAGHP